MSENNIYGRLYLLVKAMLLKPTFVAVVDNKLSEPQEILGGVVQGSSLSPLLFNYTINKAPTLVRKVRLSACAARHPLGIIAFVDGIAMVARSPEEAQIILDMMTAFAAEQKITWAPEKYTIGVEGIAPKKHIELLCTHAKAKLGYMHSVSITHLGGDLNRVIGMYKAFI
ncbi:hypothetical protein FBU31_003691 [Coemansia sp. 'formosensis']|nr:hypothetical protein FBU31_003691 [Coemansia sp. 'formosensis']